VKITSFDDFWPFYVQQHAHATTRLLHAIGSTLAIVFLALSLARSLWFLIPALVIGYGFAWIGHFFVEHNRPATFTYPLYSLLADYRMLFLMIAGRMDDEVEKHVVRRDAPKDEVAGA
jgi:hypothetical protein